MAEVKAHFAPKRPPPTERMDPEIARRTLKNLKNHHCLCRYQTMTA
jgi:hypothetical protein